LRRYRQIGDTQEENDKRLRKHELSRKPEVLGFDVEKGMAEQDLVNLQKYKRIVLKRMIMICPLYPSRAGQKVIGLICRETNTG